MSPTTGSDATLAAVLEGEYAAIYAYGALGPFLHGATLALAKQAEVAHRNERDTLLETLPDPPAPEVTYALPYPVTSTASAIALAVLVEQRCAVLWRAAVVAADPGTRQAPLDALTNTAIRAAAFRRAGGTVPGTVAFPGLTA